MKTPRYVSSQNTNVAKYTKKICYMYYIHFWHEIELMLHPLFRNSTTHLTLVRPMQNQFSTQCSGKDMLLLIAEL